MYRHAIYKIIQTHNSHRYNTTPPLQTMVKTLTNSPPTPPHPNHTHTCNTPPVITGLVKPKPNLLLYSPSSPPTPPRAKLILHQPLSSHTSHSSLARQLHYTIPEPRVPHTCPTFTTNTPPPSPAPALPSPWHYFFIIHTCNTNNSTRITVIITTAST